MLCIPLRGYSLRRLSIFQLLVLICLRLSCSTALQLLLANILLHFHLLPNLLSTFETAKPRDIDPQSHDTLERLL